MDFPHFSIPDQTEEKIRSIFPPVCNETILKRLKLPEGKLRVVLDTDTYNEVDDQFALAYAVNSPERLNVEAVYAAPFMNRRASSPKEGMEKSYREIVRLLAMMGISQTDFVWKGSDQYLVGLESAVNSEAAEDLVKRANRSAENDPLYVVAIGAITDVASALLKDPGIVEKIVVVWLGGHSLNWNHTREFNLKQDILAAKVLFGSGVPLVQIPCIGVASHLLTTIPELEAYLAGKNELCDSLLALFKAYSPDPFGWAKEIWDIATIGFLINPDWVPCDIVHSPILTDQCTWSVDTSRHFIKCANFVYRNEIFKDMFRKLGSLQTNGGTVV